MTAKCIFNLFKLRPGDWVQIPTSKNPKKTESFKVLAANYFHHPNEPGSVTCDCNYIITPKASVLSGKEDPLFLSIHPKKVIQWSISLDSRWLNKSDVKVLTPVKASKLNQKISKKSG